MIAPAALFAHRTPSSFSAVLKKYCVESPKEVTRARIMSPGRSDDATCALSTSVARMSCEARPSGVERVRTTVLRGTVTKNSGYLKNT